MGLVEPFTAARPAQVFGKKRSCLKMLDEIFWWEYGCMKMKMIVRFASHVLESHGFNNLCSTLSTTLWKLGSTRLTTARKVHAITAVVAVILVPPGFMTKLRTSVSIYTNSFCSRMPSVEAPADLILTSGNRQIV